MVTATTLPKSKAKVAPLSPTAYKLGRISAWQSRLHPKAGHDAWRGSTPYLKANPQTSVASLLRPCLTLRAASEVLSWASVRGRWGLYVPKAAAASADFSFWKPLNIARVQALWVSLLRGLGGLCRLKLRFKGKSFKWHRRRGALMLRFGHAHLVALRAFPGVRWRRFGRMKILLFGANFWDLLAYAQSVCWWRPINVYHGRGLRLKRQVVLKKAGKVSAYR